MANGINITVYNISDKFAVKTCVICSKQAKVGPSKVTCVNCSKGIEQVKHGESLGVGHFILAVCDCRSVYVGVEFVCDTFTIFESLLGFLPTMPLTLKESANAES